MRPMNPGYIALWIIAVAVILICTGWEELVCPGIRKRYALFAAAACFALQPVHVQAEWDGISVSFGGSVLAAAAAVAVAASAGERRKPAAGRAGYLLLCSFIAGMIWGSIKQIYYADPVFYWIHPVWDGPLLAGVLAVAFASKPGQQYLMLFLAACWAEAIGAVLTAVGYKASLGSYAWWDGLLIAAAAARIVTLLFYAAKTVAVKLPVYAAGSKRNGEGDMDGA